MTLDDPFGLAAHMGARVIRFWGLHEGRLHGVSRPAQTPSSLRAALRARGPSLCGGSEDPSGAFTDPVLIPFEGFQQVVRHFDGENSLSEIQDRVCRETGLQLPTSELENLVAQLDRAMVIDGPTYSSFRDDYVRQSLRPAALAGRSYPADASTLRAQLDRYFTHNDGSGLPALSSPRDRRLRAVISPHIDFSRGGTAYTWAYKELVERSDADLFVILGVAHQYCRSRFVLTRKDFDTPLGRVTTDRDYVNLLAESAGSDLFEDELVHRTEHSIEFQVVFLQYLLGGRRPFSIVPILVGSFHNLMEERVDPIEDDTVCQFIDALRSAERESGKRIAYIGGIDLSHVGPEFGDPTRVSAATQSEIHDFDASMLDRALANDPAGWFATAAAVDNRWRVCGLAATYTMLHAIGPARGRLLKYRQAIDARRTCCVSFASLAFDSTGPDS